MFEDAGEHTVTDPFRDASQGGTGGTGPGEDPPIDSGTELDAATPTDGDAGELGDAGP